MLVVVVIEKTDAGLSDASLLWAKKAGVALTELGHQVKYLNLSQEEPLLLNKLESIDSSHKIPLHPSHYLKAVMEPEFQKADLVLNTGSSSLAYPGAFESLLEMLGLRTIGNPSQSIISTCDRQMMRTLAQTNLNAIATLTISRTYSPQLLQQIAELGPQTLLRKNHSSDPRATLVDTSNELEVQTLLDQALDHTLELTMEPFLPGRFFSVAIVGNRALSCREFKYQATTSQRLIETTSSYCPSIASSVQLQMQNHAQDLHSLTGCHYLSECDFHLSNDGKLQFINFHAQPLSKDPLTFLEVVQAHGLSTHAFLQHLIDLSLAQGLAYPLLSNSKLSEKEAYYR